VREVTIRPYRTSDFDQLTVLWLESWNSAGVATPLTETLTSLRRRFPQELPAWTLHVATRGSRVIGFVAVRSNKIEQLFVHPREQSSGVGKHLLDLVKQERPQGFWLYTQVDNRGARRFYEREGMIGGRPVIRGRPGYRIVRYTWRAKKYPG
jgi:ribosomal protein S18 acetylase RimI-like enzyme